MYVFIDLDSAVFALSSGCVYMWFVPGIGLDSVPGEHIYSSKSICRVARIASTSIATALN